MIGYPIRKVAYDALVAAFGRDAGIDDGSRPSSWFERYGSRMIFHVSDSITTAFYGGKTSEKRRQIFDKLCFSLIARLPIDQAVYFYRCRSPQHSLVNQLAVGRSGADVAAHLMRTLLGRLG